MVSPNMRPVDCKRVSLKRLSSELHAYRSDTLVLEEIIREVNLVLVMTINPGFGGQRFLEMTVPKIRQVRQMIEQVNPNCELELG